MAASYRVYILQNPGGRFYIGLAEDVARRLQQHNSGESRWTKTRGPWRLVWQSDALSLSEARKLENRLKRQGAARVFTRSPVCLGVAHKSGNCPIAGSNPAPATKFSSPSLLYPRMAFAFAYSHDFVEM